MADQTRACIEVLKFFLGHLERRPKIYIVQGTEYHAGLAGENEEKIAEAIGAERYVSPGTGVFCR